MLFQKVQNAALYQDNYKNRYRVFRYTVHENFLFRANLPYIVPYIPCIFNNCRPTSRTPKLQPDHFFDLLVVILDKQRINVIVNYKNNFKYRNDSPPGKVHPDAFQKKLFYKQKGSRQTGIKIGYLEYILQHRFVELLHIELDDAVNSKKKQDTV